MRRLHIVALLIMFSCFSLNPTGLVFSAEETQLSSELEENSEGITLNQAVDLAINNSKSIKLAKISTEQSNLSHKAAEKNVSYEPAGSVSSAISAPFHALVAADISYQVAKKSQNSTEDKVVYSALSAYINLLNAIDSYKYSESLVANTTKQLQISRVSNQIGTLSSFELSQMESKLVAAQASLKDSENALTSAYEKFNDLIGIHINERPVLLERPQFALTEATMDTLESWVSRATEGNPDLLLKDLQINQASLQFKLYDMNKYVSEDYDSQELNIDKAKVSSQTAKDSAKQAVRNIYFNIIKLEEQYNSTQNAIKLAEETLRITKTKYELGMATKLEVDNAELAILEQQKNLNNIIGQHELLKIAFEKPWAAS